MKDNKQIKKEKKKKHYDKGQIFVKVVAGFLAIIMVAATLGSLIFALMV